MFETVLGFFYLSSNEGSCVLNFRDVLHPCKCLLDIGNLSEYLVLLFKESSALSSDRGSVDLTAWFPRIAADRRDTACQDECREGREGQRPIRAIFVGNRLDFFPLPRLNNETRLGDSCTAIGIDDSKRRSRWLRPLPLSRLEAEARSAADRVPLPLCDPWARVINAILQIWGLLDKTLSKRCLAVKEIDTSKIVLDQTQGLSLWHRDCLPCLTCARIIWGCEHRPFVYSQSRVHPNCANQSVHVWRVKINLVTMCDLNAHPQNEDLTTTPQWYSSKPSLIYIHSEIPPRQTSETLWLHLRWCIQLDRPTNHLSSRLVKDTRVNALPWQIHQSSDSHLHLNQLST